MINENKCVLKLEHLVFDELHFQRKGFPNENEVTFSLGFNVETREDRELIVHISLKGSKENEYDILVAATGYFALDKESPYERLALRQNAVAIIFPYIRAQMSLLTAQPEMPPIVIPPMNVAQMVEDAEKAKGSDS